MIYNRIYIVSPVGVETGGPETLHQMCKVINENYPNTCYMVYIDKDGNFVDAPVPKKYEKYNVNHTDKVEDIKENILITTEIHTFVQTRFQNITKRICWLSYLFYFNEVYGIKTRLPYSGFLRAVKPLVYLAYFLLKPGHWFAKNKKLKLKQMKNFLHSYNTIEEKKFLAKHGIESKNYLCGPISDDYFENQNVDLSTKENIISYNPKKGYSYTKKIIKLFKEKHGDKYQFVPIENMSNQEVIDVLKRSKVYIDFGFFPGHERIPRQAVLLKANIITSTNGSAKYDDILIDSKYKFDTKSKNLKKIVETMFELAEHHKEHVDDYDEYREFTNWQRDNYKNEVLAICDNKPFEFEAKSK